MANKKSAAKEFSDLDDAPAGEWPPWARGLASAVLAFHFLALIGAITGGGQPASMLEMGWYAKFLPYYDLFDQGYPYRYYAPEPPPTPVVEATLRFADGRPEEVIRLPDRNARPLLRYQRQLALAYHLDHDYKQALAATGSGGRSRLAHSYARHLCRTHPGCTGVKLTVRDHRIPPLERAIEALESHRSGRSGGKGRSADADPESLTDPRESRGSHDFDPDAEEFYDTPERIGDFPCDGL